MSLESFHNYFVIMVKSRKNDEKFGSGEIWAPIKKCKLKKKVYE